MKYYDTHSCGHEGMVDLGGPGKQREWQRKRYFDDECPECAQKRRDAENAESAARSKALGLPTLVGTAKQVAWAETKRMKFCDASDAYEPDPNSTVNVERLYAVVSYILEHEVFASFWIENSMDFRGNSFAYAVAEYARKNAVKVKAYLDAPVQERAPAADSVDDAELIRPAEVKHEGVATVVVAKVDEQRWIIDASFTDKNDRFIEIMRKLDFVWKSERRSWTRSVGDMYGPGDDRAADVASRLIDAGFCVRCDSDTVRRMIETGEYQPEKRSWVAFCDEGSVSFKFDRDDDLNEKVRRMGARWNGSGYKISADKYARIEEFARLYGFSITPKAQELLRAAREQIEGASVVDPTVQPALRPKDNPLAEILNSSREVLPDLKDD